MMIEGIKRQLQL